MKSQYNEDIGYCCNDLFLEANIKMYLYSHRWRHKTLRSNELCYSYVMYVYTHQMLNKR